MIKKARPVPGPELSTNKKVDMDRPKGGWPYVSISATQAGLAAVLGPPIAFED